MKEGDVMDMSMMVTPNIPMMANTMSAIKTGNDVGVAMLSKTLDNSQAQGSEMVKMMEQSVNPAVGGNFDMRV